MHSRWPVLAASLLLFSGSIAPALEGGENGAVAVSSDWPAWPSASSEAGPQAVPVVLHIDAGVRRPAVAPRVSGIVMQVVNESSPSALAQEMGLSAGRFATFGHNHAAHNMPECWSGDPADFEALDAQIGKGLAGGLNPRRIHLQLLYLSPCDVAEELGPVLGAELGGPVGVQGVRLQKGYYPTLTSAAIVSNRDAIEGMLHDQMRHVVDTWGIQRFTVWNEPDLLYPIPLAVYLDYYAVVNGVLRDVERETGRDLELGGPVTAFPNEVWIRALLDHVVNHELDLDEVVFHAYAKGSANAGPTSAKYVEQIAKVRSWVADAQARQPDLDPAIHINEWGYDALGTDSTNVDGAGAAFIASTLTTFADEGLDAADYFSYQDPRKPPTTACPTGVANHAGYGLLDCHDAPRPAYHAFRFFNELGRRRLVAEPSSEGVQGRQEWGGIVARQEDGSLRALVHNWDPARTGVSISVTLDVEGFNIGEWRAEEIGVSTLGLVGASYGAGTPSMLVPPNHVVFVVLDPAVDPSRDEAWESRG